MSQVESLLLDRTELAKLLRISVETVERMERDGRIPLPVELGPRTKRWRREEITAWIDSGCPVVDPQRSMKGAPNEI